MDETVSKTKSLTIQEKLEIIEMVERGKSVKDVSEETGINRNSLHYILKNRYKIRDEVFKNPTLSKHKRIKQTKNPKLEAAILNYIYEAREKGEKLTGSIIKAVALEMSIKMNINNFGGSNGWLFSFFKRNGLSISDFNNKLNETIPRADVTVPNYENETSDIQFEIEYTDDTDNNNIIDDNSRIIESEWKFWCKFCGSTEQTETIYELDDNSYDFLRTFFRFNFDEIKCCERCKLQFEDTERFLMRAKAIESMFIEIDEQDSQNNATVETVNAIRQKYLENDVENEEMQLDNEPYEEEPKESDQIEPEDIIYEEDYLEEEVNEFDHDDNYVVIEESIDIPTDDLEMTSKSQDEENYIFECHICGENFERMCFLTNHTRQLHNCLPQVACSCGKYLATWDSLMAHKRKHSTEPADWICDTCDSRFQTKTGLSIHIKFKHNRNSPDIKPNCNICSIEFRNTTALKSHARTYHSQNEMRLLVECKLCMKKLSNKYSLKAHIATVHEKQKTILCHLCSKGFSNKSNLRSHLVSHTTEYISCHICNQVFKNRVSLQSHKKIHKPQESLKFVCSHCGKRFHNRNHLERHLVAHSTEKKFKCTFDGCDAAYKWEKDLRNHESIHKGIKKHQCQYCDRFFTDVGNLRKHKLKHHQDELSEHEKLYGRKRSMV